MPQHDVRRIYATVEEEFQAVNTCIMEQLHSDVPMVENIGHYIIDAGGKRLRPLLVLLGAKACLNPGSPHIISLAAIIEFLHTATLLHDDVVDTSDLRRGRATANAKWGNAPSVLVGDFIYSRAFQMLVDIGHLEVMHTLSSTTNIIAEGEVMQLMNVRNPNISESQYMDVIRRKTAALFEAATYAAGLLSETSADNLRALKTYGEHLGLAFQLVDDVLDYTGDAHTMGKNVGDDLAEGKMTLPLIYAMSHGTSEQAAVVRHAIDTAGLESLDQVLAIVQESGAIGHTTQKAREHADIAIQAISTLPATPYREAMIDLARLSVSRTD